MTSGTNETIEGAELFIPVAVTHQSVAIDQPLNGVFNELHVDVTNNPSAPLLRTSIETTITNPSSSQTSSSLLTPPISPCIENSSALPISPVTATMPPPKSFLKKRKTLNKPCPNGANKPSPNVANKPAPKLGRKASADVAELPWEVSVVVVSTGEEYTRVRSRHGSMLIGFKLTISYFLAS